MIPFDSSDWQKFRGRDFESLWNEVRRLGKVSGIPPVVVSTNSGGIQIGLSSAAQKNATPLVHYKLTDDISGEYYSSGSATVVDAWSSEETGSIEIYNLTGFQLFEDEYGVATRVDKLGRGDEEDVEEVWVTLQHAITMTRAALWSSGWSDFTVEHPLGELESGKNIIATQKGKGSNAWIAVNQEC